MRQPIIVALGEVLWDQFPSGEQFGGAPANFACHAAIGGAEVILVSAIGDDERGHEAIRLLDAVGVRVRLLQTVKDAPTGTVGVELDARGKATFTIHESAAWDQLQWQPEGQAALQHVDAVYFGTLGQRSAASRQTIRRYLSATRAAGIPVILDVNLRAPFFNDELIRESIELADILKLSEDELVDVSRACGIDLNDPPEVILRHLLEDYDLTSVVMTCGAGGAILATHDGVVTQTGIAAVVEDTVGAGDSFAATYLLGLLHGEPHDVVLRIACEQAAATCSHAGAVPKHYFARNPS